MPSQPSSTKLSSSIKNAYNNLALVCLNTLLLLLAFNIAIGLLFSIKDARSNAGSQKAQAQALARATGGHLDIEAFTTMDRAEAEKFAAAHQQLLLSGFQYQPWVQFGMPHFSGYRIDTDASGFRVVPGQPEHSKDVVDVFVFGGSTTFGFGVPDQHTIPSELQRILSESEQTAPVRVSNFGQNYYYSSQELILFLSKLKNGEIPDYAVFVDGLNDTFQLSAGIDIPQFSADMSRAWDLANGDTSAESRPSPIPMLRLTNALRSRMQGDATADQRRFKRAKLNAAERADFVVQRYTRNRRMIKAIAREFGVTPLFIWQPTPLYKYDISQIKKWPYPSKIPAYWDLVFEHMATIEHEDYIYLGDMVDGIQEPAFVDAVHYNEKYNGKIAQAIANRIGSMDNGTPAKKAALDDSSETGQKPNQAGSGE